MGTVIEQTNLPQTQQIWPAHLSPKGFTPKTGHAFNHCGTWLLLYNRKVFHKQNIQDSHQNWPQFPLLWFLTIVIKHKCLPQRIHVKGLASTSGHFIIVVPGHCRKTEFFYHNQSIQKDSHKRVLAEDRLQFPQLWFMTIVVKQKNFPQKKHNKGFTQKTGHAFNHCGSWGLS